MQETNKKPANRTHKVIHCVSAVVIIILLLLLFRSCNEQSANVCEVGELQIMGGNVQDGALPGMSSEELLEYMQKETDENNVVLSINTTPVCTDTCYLAIENPHYSTHDMSVEYYLADETLIYSSGLIQPDQHIEYDTLLVQLADGEHEAFARFIFLNDGAAVVNIYEVELTIEKL